MNLSHIAVGLTVTSLGLYATMMAFFFRALLTGATKGSRRARGRAPSLSKEPYAPVVTVFKPLAGRDEDLEENLESFARLEYPAFEILLGVAAKTDPAFPVAQRFVAAHPPIRARVVLTDPAAAINPKVAQLVSMEREATGDVFVISDSNVRVRPTYLRSLVDELEDGRVGLVCSIFSGGGERSVGAALENLQLCASSIPGLLALDAVTDRPPTVGKSMAMRRRDLQQVGGFAPLGEVLAEDHALGRRLLDAGFTARTSLEIVENRNVVCSVWRTLERHTRWSKMRRVLFPVAFVAEPLVTPLNTATLAVVVCPSRATALAWCTACVFQTFAAMLAVRVLRGAWMSWKYVPLELVRSYVALFCWMRACVSRRIEWRGHSFLLGRGTTIEPIVASASSDGSQGRARLAA